MPLRGGVGLVVRRAEASAAARASWRLRVLAACSWRSAIALTGVPRRVILNLGEWSGRMVLSAVGGKGAFCIPGLGAMRSFWFSAGISRMVSIAAERSWSVADVERWKVCGVPWWCTGSSREESIVSQRKSEEGGEVYEDVYTREMKRKRERWER